MKIAAIPIILLLTNCGVYHYIPTTVNTAMYDHKGEVQLSAQVGSAGIAATGGLAITKNININSFVAWLPEVDNGYNSRELDFSIGYQTSPRAGRGGITSFWLGTGYGSNEYDEKEFAGTFVRPYFQIQHGTHDRKLGRGSIYFDAFIGSRFNYLLYNGRFYGAQLDDVVFSWEPYYGFSIGGRNVRFYTTAGFSVGDGTEDEPGEARVFPVWGNFGLQVKFRKR